MPIKRTKEGFTLVELIICIAILSIISIVALPYIKNYFITQERKRLYHQIQYSIRTASYSAIIYHSNIVLCPSSNTNQCDPTPNSWNEHLIIFIDKNKNRQVDTNDQIITVENLKLKYGNLIWRGALRQPSLNFRGTDGLPIGSNGSFFYCSTMDAENQRIVLSKMGHLRREKTSDC